MTKVLGEQVMMSLILGELKSAEVYLSWLFFSGHACC